MAQEYYYLEYYAQQHYWEGFHYHILAKDIERGVTTLSESSYSQYYGATRTSLRFLLVIYKVLGHGLTGKSAKLEKDVRGNFVLRVETVEGYTLVFQGVSGGYYGEGTRGCHDILKSLGFSKTQCNYPFEKETFRCSRRI